ncbi:MAG: alpha/beta fold hydrolase [Chloroflexi bacterium]|nr:alpha/beta fold hydrolase [Chloroflexota bacterium]
MADLVLIHGAADSAAIWDGLGARFEHVHRVLAVDLPGHGERLAQEPLDTVPGMAEDVVRQIEGAGLAHPVLVGHSMGGAVALTVALTRPRLPSGVVLVASGARLRMRPDILEQAREIAVAAPRFQVVPRVIPLDRVMSAEASEELCAWLQSRIGQSTAQATYADFTAIHHFDVRDRLYEIEQPNLVVGGEQDAWTPPRFQHFLAEHLPHARLVLLPTTGHYPWVEQAAVFAEELEHFLREVD